MQRRGYQVTGHNNVLSRREAGVRKQLLVQATGTGKTIGFAFLTFEMPKGAQEIVIAHREELIDQAAEKIAKVNPSLSIGIEMGDRRADGREDVIVGAVQTMKNPKRLAKFDPNLACWLIIDEAHHAPASSYGTVIDHFMVNPNTTLVGYTATPERSDGVAMGSRFDEVVFTYDMFDAIQDGWLVDVHSFAARTETDISKVGSQDGDYKKADITKAVDTFARNEGIVRDWIKWCWPRQTVVFTVDVRHALNIAAAFKRQGIKAEAVWGEDPDRRKKLDAFRRGEITVLVNCQLLIEGFDMWQVECVIPATPTKSTSKFTQMIGRGTRLEDIEDMCIIGMNAFREQGRLTDSIKQHCLVMDVLDIAGKHSLVSVPSLFGLPPKLNLQGRSASQAKRDMNNVMKRYPNADLHGLEEIDQMETYARRVDLFRVKFAEEVKGFSEMQWTKRGDGSYRLALPKNEFFTVREDLVGKFEINGVLSKKTMKAERVASLAEAVRLVEKAVADITPDNLRLLGREQKWMKKAISADQLRILRQLKVPPERIAMMSKGEASAFITERFNTRGR